MTYPTPADYRAKYPPGSVPFLEDDDGGVAMGESIAMMLYLAQRYGPTSLLPAEPQALARTLQLTVAAEAAMGGLMNPLMATAFVAPDDQKANWTANYCVGAAQSALNYAASLLGDREFLVGEALTLADLAIATTLGMWEGALGKVAPSNLAHHRARTTARPGFARAKAAFSAERGA